MKGSIYHLLNRGVEKRKIFLNEKDHVRFIHNLEDFNDIENVVQSYYRRREGKALLTEVVPPSGGLVDIICWTLMPNHPHLMVVEKNMGDVGVFSRKVFGGYTMYFNEQNDRSGVLFQGRSKVIQIKRDAHLLYLPFYIHLNPLDLFQYGWKKDGIRDVKGAMKFLEEYRWSNYRDIIGKGNGEFADVTNKELFYRMFQTNARKYKKDLEDWIRAGGYKQDFSKFE